MKDPVPAVAEAEAYGEISAIFADIRAVYRVSVVNLIWRHLATIPGALAWTWSTVRPLYVDGRVARAAEFLRAEMALPPCPVIPPFVFAAAGLGGVEMTGIRAVLAAYDRTNPMALVALSVARAQLDGPWHGDAAAGDAPKDIGAELELPRLLSLDEMEPHTASLVLALNRIGSQRADSILASMYRNLAHWPGYLSLAWTLLAPLDEGDALISTIETVRARATELARQLALPETATPMTLALEHHPVVAAALDRFTSDAIGRMVVICAVLRRATG